MLHRAGWKGFRHLGTCETFADYLALADSSLLISLSHIGDKAACEMQEKLDIPALNWRASYDVDEVGRQYRELFVHTDPDEDLLSLRREQVMVEVERTKNVVTNTPVMVDSAASMRPFSLALALLNYGFNVKAVFSLHQKDPDIEAKATRARLPEPEVRGHTGLSHVASGLSMESAAFLLRSQALR